MPQASFAEQLTAGQPDLTVKDLQRNALSKQYNAKLSLVITETDGNKKFFDGAIEYTGIAYPMVVILEDELVKLEAKLVELGKTIATGSTTPPA